MRVTLTDQDTPVWRVTLAASSENDADARIDPVGVTELVRLLGLAEAATECRVIVLAGQRGRFCMGMDLGYIAAHPETDLTTEVHKFAESLRLLRQSSKVVICAVDGPAHAGGLGMAVAGDVVIATDRASFALPELVLGLVPAVVLPVLLERVSPQRARLLTLQSSQSAAEAMAWGLIDQLVPADEAGSETDALEKAVRAVCKQVLRCKPSAVALCKRHCEAVAGQELGAALRASADCSAALIQQPETMRDIAAFLQGEPMPWSARYRPGKDRLAK